MPRIVIISYGLRRHTRDALQRVGRAADHVHLVAALPQATRGLRTHRSRFVTVEEGVGRDALRSALEADDRDTVLMLHEDVLLAPEAAARLLEVAGEAGGTIVVPSTNHRDVDNSVGVGAPEVVPPLGEPTRPRQARRFRTACLAAPAWRLIELLDHRLTAATTRLQLQETPAAWVTEAVATHLDLGRDVTEPPEGPDGRPLLVASMIVRDEETMLPGCLASLEGVVDRVDVCDTGSTDRTIEVAREAGAQVIERPWRDDFAAARNEALELSRDAWWVIQVDADERLRTEDADELRSFLATALPDGDAFEIPLRSVTDEGTVTGSMHLPRLFRPEGVAYDGAIHEIPRRRDGRRLHWSVFGGMVHLDHLGYRREHVTDRDKAVRNLRIARAEHERHGTPATAFQLARSLAMSGNHDGEALGLLADLHEAIGVDDQLNDTARITIHQLYAIALRDAGRVEDAYDVARAGLERYPTSALLRSTHAELGVSTGRFEDVVAAEAAADDQPEDARPWSAEPADAARLIELATSQLAVGDTASATSTTEQLLSSPALGVVDRWPEVISLVAMTMAEKAEDVLLDAVARDTTGRAIRAVAAAFHEADAAAFAVAVARSSDPAPDQREALEDVVVAHADNRLVADLLEALGAGAAEGLWDRIDCAPREVVLWLAARVGHPVPEVDLDAALLALASGDLDDRDRLVAHLAADRSAESLRRLAGEVPPAVAAPIAADAVVAGARADCALRVALALVVVRDDVEAMRAIAPHLDALDTDTLDAILQRAAGRGATGVTTVLSNVLLERTSVGGDQGTS